MTTYELRLQPPCDVCGPHRQVRAHRPGTPLGRVVACPACGPQQIPVLVEDVAAAVRDGLTGRGLVDALADAEPQPTRAALRGEDPDNPGGSGQAVTP